MTWTAQDFQFMSRAIQLAKRGRYTCKPNPRVGCVVSRDGKIIAEGWHAIAGEGHAEIIALNQCNDISGSSIYVTLEPCSHHGRTPPCVDALIKAQVKQVNIAMLDPNPLVVGKGIEQLQESGIVVKQGLLENEAIKLNRGFIKRMASALPYTRCKMAMSLDGRTALSNGDSQWISSEQSRRDVHRLRAMSCAILTSADSLIKDDASLNARDLDFDVKQPVRVIIDRQLKTSAQAKLFRLPGKIIIYTQVESKENISAFTDVGVEVISIPQSESWLKTIFSDLAEKQEMNEVMVEAGATFSGTLIEAGLVDELLVYVAPMLLGDTAQSLLKLNTIDKLCNAKELTLVDVRQLSNDLRLTYNLN